MGLSGRARGSGGASAKAKTAGRRERGRRRKRTLDCDPPGRVPPPSHALPDPPTHLVILAPPSLLPLPSTLTRALARALALARGRRRHLAERGPQRAGQLARDERLELGQPPLGLDKRVPEPPAERLLALLLVTLAPAVGVVGVRAGSGELGRVSERVVFLPSDGDARTRDGERARSEDVVWLRAVEARPVAGRSASARPASKRAGEQAGRNGP